MRIVRQYESDKNTEQRTATFTGLVLADPLMPTEDGVTVTHVSFALGARTHWHFHERGQILYVTSGRGLICSKGGPAEQIGAGDTIWVPPGETHWHGARPGSTMSHLAISLGTTTWLDPVEDEQYHGGPVQ